MNTYRITFMVWDASGEPSHQNMQVRAADIEDACAIFYSQYQNEDATILTIKYIA